MDNVFILLPFFISKGQTRCRLAEAWWANRSIIFLDAAPQYLAVTSSPESRAFSYWIQQHARTYGASVTDTYR
jgi:hypothetical protein